MARLSTRGVGTFVAGTAFGICLCLGRLALAQQDENAFKLFGTASALSSPDASEALRRGYLAGVYDATAADVIVVEFSHTPKKPLTGRLDCLTTHSRGDMATLSDWAYSKWSSTDNQTWSGALVLGAACHVEGYY